MTIEYNNEEIVYNYLLLEDMVNTIKNDVFTEIKMMQGYLKLIEMNYPDKFKKEQENETTSKFIDLLNNKLPDMLNYRINFLNNMKNKFESIYEVILDGAPELVEKVKEELISEPAELDEIKNNLNM